MLVLTIIPLNKLKRSGTWHSSKVNEAPYSEMIQSRDLPVH